jgi:hypothetical protein
MVGPFGRGIIWKCVSHHLDGFPHAISIGIDETNVIA